MENITAFDYLALLEYQDMRQPNVLNDINVWQELQISVVGRQIKIINACPTSL